MATKHLIDLGHKKIACILGPPSIKVNVERKKGYSKAFTEANLSICTELIVHGDV